MKLEPCPFCGMDVADLDTVAEHEYADEGSPEFEFASTHFDVVCDKRRGGCGSSTGKMYKTPEEAAEAWNRRAT